MIPGVVADRVALGQLLARELGEGRHLLADQEERRVDPEVPQDPQHVGRVEAGAVVEGERDDLAVARAVGAVRRPARHATGDAGRHDPGRDRSVVGLEVDAGRGDAPGRAGPARRRPPTVRAQRQLDLRRGEAGLQRAGVGAVDVGQGPLREHRAAGGESGEAQLGARRAGAAGHAQSGARRRAAAAEELDAQRALLHGLELPRAPAPVRTQVEAQDSPVLDQRGGDEVERAVGVAGRVRARLDGGGRRRPAGDGDRRDHRGGEDQMKATHLRRDSIGPLTGADPAGERVS